MAGVVQTTYSDQSIPSTGKPGQLALDFATKRLYFYDINGLPVYINQQIDNFDIISRYNIGDTVIYQNQIWQAKVATVIPGPFNVSDWNLLTSPLPGGGLTRQVLRKASDSTGDVEWHEMSVQVTLHNGQDVVTVPL